MSSSEDPSSVTAQTAKQREPSRTGSGVLVDRLKRATLSYLGVGGMLLIVSIYLSVTQDQFATYRNLLIILETNAVTLVAAVGLTFVLLVGGIDLSLGATIALSGTCLWELVRAGLPLGVGIAVVIVAAGLVGTLINGVLIGKVGLNFLVVTLGTASLFRGIALVRTGGQSQSMYNVNSLRSLGTDKIFGVSVLVVVALGVWLLGIVVLRYTGYGRMVYAVGGNPEAARVAGINVKGVRVSVFGICALLGGVAAVIDLARLTSASPTAATGIELTAGAAVLLGGTSFAGGRGTLLGTLLGVIFLGVLSNGITLVGVSAFWQGIVSGIVLIAAVGLDRLRTYRKAEVA